MSLLVQSGALYVKTRKICRKNYLNYDQTPCDFLLHKDWIPHDRFSNFKQVVQRVEVVPGLPVLALLAGLAGGKPAAHISAGKVGSLEIHSMEVASEQTSQSIGWIKEKSTV